MLLSDFFNMLAMAVFAWAALIGPGDTLAFGAICVLSGLALGADLALPPALLADQLARRRAGCAGACRGTSWENS